MTRPNQTTDPDLHSGPAPAAPECSYGDFTYHYSGMPGLGDGRSRRPECHRPVEGPRERSHCPDCGGDYCPDHASRGSHDCEYITDPRGLTPSVEH